MFGKTESNEAFGFFIFEPSDLKNKSGADSFSDINREGNMETICHHLLKAKTRKKVAIEYVKNRKWESLSWPQYFDFIQKCAGGLKSLGVEPSDRVVIFSNTRLEWAAFDMAILGLGAITVPIYQSSHPKDLEFIIKETEPKVIIFESKELYARYQTVSSAFTFEPKLVGIQYSDETVISWSDFTKSGQDYLKSHPAFFETSCLNTKIDDLATLVYTSGTTGTPKGVCLHHEQIISEVSEVFRIIDVDDRDKSLSFLPYAHILGRIEHWAHVYKGFTMAIAESVEKVRDNLQKAQPTFLIAVPRIFEKIYSGMQAQGESSPMKSKIFKWAMSVGYKVSEARIQKKSPDFTTLMEYRVAKRLVFDKFYQKLGGKLRFAVSGGAPLSGEIARFFHAAGLLVLEGYGLTETTAAVFVNTPYDYKFGTVGKPIGDVEVKIAEDGEILVRSKKVMRGYYKNPKATEEVFDEQDYFKTGDIGEIDAQGFLKITDRKKDLIKTAGGKFVAPQKLEGLLKLNKYVSNVLVHGDKKKYIVVLLTLNPERVKEYATQQMISYSKFEELAVHPKIKDLMRNAVAQANSSLASFETIKNFAILPQDFTIETGELTPSLKVKRKFCDQKFEKEIKSLYGDEE